MSIWFKTYTLAEIERLRVNTMVEHLGIRFVEIGADFLRATLPVDHRTHQPMGILHGGASAALAETLGSVAGAMCVDPNQWICVGQEINANHLRPVSSGEVIGTARPVHLGRRSQVWQIDIADPRGKLVCVSRLTLSVLERAALNLPPATAERPI